MPAWLRLGGLNTSDRNNLTLSNCEFALRKQCRVINAQIADFKLPSSGLTFPTLPTTWTTLAPATYCSCEKDIAVTRGRAALPVAWPVTVTSSVEPVASCPAIASSAGEPV